MIILGKISSNCGKNNMYIFWLNNTEGFRTSVSVIYFSIQAFGSVTILLTKNIESFDSLQIAICFMSRKPQGSGFLKIPYVAKLVSEKLKCFLI